MAMRLRYRWAILSMWRNWLLRRRPYPFFLNSLATDDMPCYPPTTTGSIEWR